MISNILLIVGICIILFICAYYLTRSSDLDRTRQKIFPTHISQIKLNTDIRTEPFYDLVIRSAPRELTVNEKIFLLQYKKFVSMQTVYSMVEPKEISQIKFLLEDVIKNNIPGCIVETGVWRGGMSMWMQAILKYHKRHPDIWLFDAFGKFPPPSSDPTDQYIHSVTEMLFEFPPTVSDVKNNFRAHNLLDSNVKFVVGDFKQTIPQNQIKSICLLHCDSDYYDSTKIVLENLYEKISPGGYVVIDDYNNTFLGCKTAVDEFRLTHHIQNPIIDTHGGSVYWRK